MADEAGAGRAGEPEDYLVALWRAIAVFRVAALGYATLIVAQNFPGYRRPYGGWVVLGVMALWTAFTVLRFPAPLPPPRRRALPLFADLFVTAGCVLATDWVESAARLVTGASPIAVMWMGGPVLAWAAAFGRRAGLFAGAVIGLCDVLIHTPQSAYTLSQLAFAPGLLLLSGAAVGYLARLAVQTQAALEHGTRLQAAARERDRLARDIHDSVLQVLARVQQQGLAAGGEAAELGRLAGEQEAALRALVGMGAADPEPAAGIRDIRVPISASAGARASVAAPATAVLLPTHTADELLHALRAALDNTARHCPPGTRVWILIEDEPEAVTVTLRDDGPGFAPDRLEQAASAGRLGVAQSILGRIHELGGHAHVRSRPGEGTEVELRVPHSDPDPGPRPRPRAAGRDRG
jgi:signal transduction histidine kinase